MNKEKEYFQSKEYNQFEEFVCFPAEEYKSPDECSDKSKESLNYPEKNNLALQSTNKNDSGFVRKMLNKISGHTSKVAAKLTAGLSAAVVGTVGAVTVFSPLLAPTPEFDLKEWKTGADYAYYSVYAEDFEEDISYSVEVTNGTQKLSFPLYEGVNENKVDGLLPGYEYTMTFVGSSENRFRMEYFKKKFYTFEDEEQKQEEADIRIDVIEMECQNGIFDLLYRVDLSEFKEKDLYEAYVVYAKRGEEIFGEAFIPHGELYGEGFLERPPNGEYEFAVYGISPEMKGELQLIYSKKHTFEKQTHFNPIPEQYGAHFRPVPPKEIEVETLSNGNHILRIPTEFENGTNLNFYYRVTAYDENGYNTFYEGTDRMATLEIDKGVSSVKIYYEALGVFGGEVVLFHRYDTEGELRFPPENYGAHFRPVPPKEIEVETLSNGNHILRIPTEFENGTNLNFYYRVTAYDENGYNTFYEGTDRIATLLVDKDIASVKIYYEALGVFGGEVVLFKRYDTEGELFFVPEKYGAFFDRVPLDQIKVENDSEGRYILNLPLHFENPTPFHFYYRVTVFNESGVLDVYTGTEQNITFTLPKGTPKIQIRYEALGKFNGEEVVYDVSEPLEELILMPVNYGAHFDKTPCNEMKVQWNGSANGNHLLTIPLNFTNPSGEPFFYRVIVTGPNGFRKTVQGTEKEAVLEIDSALPFLEVTYEEIGIFEGKTKVYSSQKAEGKVLLEAPKFKPDEQYHVKEYSMELGFMVEDPFPLGKVYESLEVTAILSSGNEQTFRFERISANEALKIQLPEVPFGCDSIMVKAVLHMKDNYGGYSRTVVFPTKEYKLIPTLELLSAEVDAKEQRAELIFGCYMKDESRIIVKDADTGELYPMDGTRAYVPVMKEVHLIYYLATPDGTALTPEKTLTLLPGVQADYQIHTPDLQKALVTNNEDSTKNVYFNLGFQSADPNVYYKIPIWDNYGEHLYLFRESIAVLENLTEAYNFEYKVCKDVDGVTYVLERGRIPIPESLQFVETHQFSEGVENDTVTVFLNTTSYKYDFTSASVIEEDGTEIPVKESAFEKNPNGGIQATIDVKKTTTQVLFKIKLYSLENQKLYDEMKSSVEIHGNIASVETVPLYR